MTFLAKGKYRVGAPNTKMGDDRSSQFKIGEVVELKYDQHSDSDGDVVAYHLDGHADGYIHADSLTKVSDRQAVLAKIDLLKEQVAALEEEITAPDFTNQGIYRTNRGDFVVKSATGRVFYTVPDGGWIEVSRGQYDDDIVEKIELSSL
ncbi:hypothetical protein SEA_NEDARYA_72 [Gordonia phage Nedarya]|nr:hypothetical protein SEA_NEDARYA_72 [Gordonia phage Nedarya]